MLTLQIHPLCDFANAIPSSRNLIEGQKVVNSGMIIMCGVTSKSNKSIELFALCLQTSPLTAEPHTITGTLKINDSNNNEIFALLKHFIQFIGKITLKFRISTLINVYYCRPLLLVCVAAGDVAC